MFSWMWRCFATLVLPDVSEERAALFFKRQDVQEYDEHLEMSGNANPGTRHYISKYQIAVFLTAKTSCFVFISLLCDQSFSE